MNRIQFPPARHWALMLGVACSCFFSARGQEAGGSSNTETNDAIARIREEGLNHSQVMETLSYLTDVIGPRLTGSPNLKHANDWTREKLETFGLTNAHLEAWGPFGRGWSLKKFSAQVTEPMDFPLIAYPNAWSPGFSKPLVANVVWFDVRTNTDLEKYKGKLKGAIVLNGSIRELSPRFDPLAVRLVDTNLLRLANAAEPASSGARFVDPLALGQRGGARRGGPSGGEGARGSRVGGRGGFRGPGRNLAFLAKEGAALVVTPSSIGDGGSVFVAAASVPIPEGSTFSFTNMPRAWSTNVTGVPPQMTIAAEDFNRLCRMIQQGEKVKMAVDLQVQFHNKDLMAYNTVAEIPGTDLKDEIVMLGGHMDSWHSGTGATDNGAGVAAAMEAVRIIKAAKLQPRRTIRIALWSGEEQGLMGSRAYVGQHFGYYTNSSGSMASGAEPRRLGGRGGGGGGESAQVGTNTPSSRKLVRLPEYEKLSAYFNLDNGAGRVRGIYLQGNESVRPLFRKWLEPFRDLDAETVTSSNTGGTDHQSFDAIGLPGFQFIQDPLDYTSRTHHSNEDLFDRIPPDDLKQAAVLFASFVYDAAMLDQKLPRKPSQGE